MHTLYDTRAVHPLDRYEYYRAEAAAELAPVSVHGRSPGHLLAVMSVAKIGDFQIETFTWGADREVVVRRTEQLIRTSDPGWYRIFLSSTPGARAEQADHRVEFRARDIALYDVSLPWTATHLAGPTPMRVIMLTFPQALVPIDPATVRPLVGTLTPRNMPGRSLLAQLIIGLAEPTATDDPGLAEVLRECVVELIRQRLGASTGITPHARRLLQQAHINGILRQHLDNPALDPGGIARAANISPRYLHTIFQDADLSPMQLLKRLRLQEAHRRLQNPAPASTSIKDIMSAVGYVRPDQFARDFRQLFGVSATQARRLAGERSSYRGA
ncbi:MAG TPA: AraC family transcriptional regulator [Mycobacteriales bacterium]|nr:AraC family transcriptional regulator [Mycobacteriales bacterium]